MSVFFRLFFSLFLNQGGWKKSSKKKKKKKKNSLFFFLSLSLFKITKKN